MDLKEKKTNEYAIYQGDSVELIKNIPDNSIDLSVFSPPFPGMYAYTDSPRDMGNCASIKEMLTHFEFLIPELLRVIRPGRHCCVHLTQSPLFKGVDGRTGLKDFRGDVIRAFEKYGWTYYGEVCIDKDPQIKAIRTRDASLQFKSLATDSARMRMALADYIIQFKKEGVNKSPIPAGISERYKNMDGWITPEEWIEWAAPVWYRQSNYYPGGIKETEVLNTKEAKDNKDEKHVCPLQLGVIERCVKLWTNPGETVFSPFMGIGSEGYESVRLFRKFIGFELKPSYFKVACQNLDNGINARNEMTLA